MTAVLPVPLAVARDDHSPCPRVEVSVFPAADTATATLTRRDPTGAHTVRGGFRFDATDTAVIVDYEAPFGVPLTYTATGYDTAGRPAAPSLPTDPVTLADPDCPWLHAALRPGTAIQLTPYDWPTQEHDRVSTIVWPATADAAVAIVNLRPRPTSDMGVLTRTPAEAAALADILTDPTVCLRPASSWGFAGGMFYADDITEDRYAPKAVTDARRLWSFTLIPVATPPPTLVEPATTWAQVVSFYATWADVYTTKATWLRLVAAPDPGAP